MFLSKEALLTDYLSPLAYRSMIQTRIRRLSETDFDLIFEWENLEEFWRVSDENGPFDREQIASFMQRCLIEEGGEIKRWIIETDTHVPIGIIDLFNIDWLLKSADVGIMIASEEFRGKGHARRALNLLIQRLLKEKWTLLRALIHEDNEASLKLFESLQFSAGARKLHRSKAAIQYVCFLSYHEK
jgi:diamine N-acetyltransferase